MEHKPASRATVIGYLALGAALVAGMMSAIAVLVYEGLNAATGHSVIAYKDGFDLFVHASPLIVVTILLTVAVFAWIYIKYGETIRRNL